MNDKPDDSNLSDPFRESLDPSVPSGEPADWGRDDEGEPASPAMDAALRVVELFSDRDFSAETDVPLVASTEQDLYLSACRLLETMFSCESIAEAGERRSSPERMQMVVGGCRSTSCARAIDAASPGQLVGDVLDCVPGRLDDSSTGPHELAEPLVVSIAVEDGVVAKRTPESCGRLSDCLSSASVW